MRISSWTAKTLSSIVAAWASIFGVLVASTGGAVPRAQDCGGGVSQRTMVTETTELLKRKHQSHFESTSPNELGSNLDCPAGQGQSWVSVQHKRCSRIETEVLSPTNLSPAKQGAIGPLGLKIHVQENDLQNILRTHLQQILAEEKSPGVTLAVVMPKGEMIRLALGVEDIDLPNPMPLGAPMFSGSVGKIFVSTLVLLLTAEQKIELDQKAAHYLGHLDWFSRLPNAESITVRSLLNHTSGLPRYIFQPAFLETVKTDPQRTWTPEQCLAVILDKPAVHPVGEGWGYSDTNYQILGLIIEQVSGKTYYDLLQSRLLEPHQLRHTFPSTQAELPGLTQGHIGPDNFFNLPRKTVTHGRYAMNPQFEWCGGGLVTNVDDLARFAQALYGGKILPAELQKQLEQAVSFRDGQPADQGYGLGAFIWDTPHGRFIGHSGVMPGHLTHVEYSIKHGFSIALQFNHDAGMGRKHHTFAQRLADTIILEIEKSVKK